MPAVSNGCGIVAIATRASVSVANNPALFRTLIVRKPSKPGSVSQQTFPVRPVALTTNLIPSF
jgi:hypothetical protein